MALILKTVPPRRGMRWVREGFTQFARKPLAFTLMFVAFLFAAMVVSLVPLVGGVLQMALLPLLSLGFMVATQSALLDGRVSPRHFIEPLQADAGRRRSLLILCGVYGVAAVLILLLCDAVSNHAMQRLQELVSRTDTPQAEIDALLSEPGVSWAVMIAAALGTALSIPFWHAPALVHWGGQSVGQSLFSSTLAVWRCKGAFLAYGLTWAAVIIVFGLLSALIFGLMGARQMGSIIALPAALTFSTVFYISLLFSFNDSFGGTPDVPPMPKLEG